MSNRKEYSIGSCSEGESFDLSRSPSNSVTGNKAYYIGACSIGESFNLSASPYNSVSNSIAYNLDNLCPYGCFTGDSYITTPSGASTALVGYDYYGALGPSVVWNTYIKYPWINQCDWIVYCDGPIDEAVTMTGQADRYNTRWVAYILGGVVYYGKVDGVMVAVGIDLIPRPVTKICLGFCFDANGRPVFSISDSIGITIYRYVDDIPTTYSITGSCAKLFFDGILNPDNSVWDVVCYYIRENGLYGRFQRENFAIENLIADGGLSNWTAIKSMAYVRATPTYHYIAVKNGPDSSILRCGPYPVWPETVNEIVYASAVFNSDLDYTPVIIDCGTYSESAIASAAFNSDLHYQPVIVNTSSSDAATASVAFNSDVSYEQVIMLGWYYTDASTSTAYFNADIHYYESIVGPITETESVTVSASFNSDIDYTV